MRRLILAAVLLPLSAAAADKPAPGEQPGTHVEMPFLIAPMSVAGKLQGYAYISSKLVSASPGASVAIREKLAFIQDAFVRDVNVAPIGKAADPLAVDTVLLGARLLADARRIVGASQVVAIAFTQIQFSPLHPAPTTEGAVAPPERAQGKL
ncbi:MAG: hypothetical protein JO261_09115 [Alphaproteobacteria bacterium]|nr:hypothetical protein [Alphaproteobacteria bacterium]MBV9693849.1 hypothetical protein [Alphaproteobacteria bacterium]